MKDSDIQSQIQKEIKDNNTFLIANMESIMKDHSQPSPVTLEMIKRLEEWIKEIKVDNKDRDKDILEKLSEIKEGQKIWMDTVDREHKEIRKDVREMQDWKLVSKTERALAYSTAAFFGSIVGSLILMVFNTYIFK